ncbi:MAG: hypothetical protein HYY78_17890 [Betaproteobacteria bacterium]|nr:hypothetical protein [Betaproteobacteria bacterium]
MNATKARSAAAPRRRPKVMVDDAQRRRLIECCAFFRAERFRAAEPGHFREQDWRAAAADIDAVLRPARKRKKR